MGGRLGRNWRVTDTEYTVSFWGNETVLKLIMKSILYNSVNILKITELYNLNWGIIWYVNCVSIRLFLKSQGQVYFKLEKRRKGIVTLVLEIDLFVILGPPTLSRGGQDKKRTQPPAPSAPSLSSKECDGAAVFSCPCAALSEGEGELSRGFLRLAGERSGGGEKATGKPALLLNPAPSALGVPGSPRGTRENRMIGKGWSKKYGMGKWERKKTRRQQMKREFGVEVSLPCLPSNDKDISTKKIKKV